MSERFEMMCAECRDNYASWLLREFNSGPRQRMFSSDLEVLRAFRTKVVRFTRKGREEQIYARHKARNPTPQS
jgi:hypothetical protein